MRLKARAVPNISQRMSREGPTCHRNAAPGAWLRAGAVCLLALGWFCASDARADEKREPARQVPVEEIEAEPAFSGESGVGAASEDEQPDGTVSETENGAGEAAVKNEKDPVAGKEKPPQETGTQSPPNDKPKATKTKPRKNTVPASKKTEPGSGADFGATASDDKAKKPADKPDAEQQKSAYPGLPRRKPPKPNVRRIPLDQAVSRKKTPSGRDRDAYLCQSLQACRNDFIKCKSKIKHPDQSQAWIDEKEACGAVYKKCVQQHFKPGEWFFTRWFYFQELDCK